MQALVDRSFQAMGVFPRVTMEMENTEAIKALVRAGLGAAILPLCSIAGAQGYGLRAMRIRGFPMERNLALALPKLKVVPQAIERFSTQLAKALAGKTVAEIRAERAAKA